MHHVNNNNKSLFIFIDVFYEVSIKFQDEILKNAWDNYQNRFFFRISSMFMRQVMRMNIFLSTNSPNTNLSWNKI